MHTSSNQQQQQQGPGSPEVGAGGSLHVSASQTNSLVNDVMSPSGGGGQLNGQMGVPLPTGGSHPHESSLLHRPSYSINGILGIPQPDANANSIAGIKRKRDGEDGLTLNSHEHHASEIDIKRPRGGLNNPHNIPVSSPVTSVTGYNGNVLNAGDIYNSMWSTPPPSSVDTGHPSSNGSGLNNHNGVQKWAQSHPNIKEEPKGGVGVPPQTQSLTTGGPPLREILGAATNHGSPAGGHESPHPSFHYAAAAAAAATSGFPTGK